jgi:prepilin-type processing-associated H-X9-DG protein
MTDRARLSKVAHFRAERSASSFAGSDDFPPHLVDICIRRDPRGILFGTDQPRIVEDAATQQRLREVLRSRQLVDKQILVLSGAEDKLVPGRCSRAFLDFLKHAANTWYADGHVVLEERSFPDTGHEFSPDMVGAAAAFIANAVTKGPHDGRSRDRSAQHL